MVYRQINVSRLPQKLNKCVDKKKWDKGALFWRAEQGFCGDRETIWIVPGFVVYPNVCVFEYSDH